MDLDGARVLVTGGCGLIGSRIVRELSRWGAKVMVLDSLDAYPFEYAHRFGAASVADTLVRGDVGDADLVRDMVAEADIVIHAAAYADIAGCLHDPDRDFASNVMGTHNVLRAARCNRLERLVFLSSSSVYDPGPVDGRAPRFAEGDRTMADSTYANSKLWGEWQTRIYDEHYGVRTTILRYFSVYGSPQVPKERSHSWCVSWFVMRAVKGKPLELHGGGAQVRDFVYVDDVASATVRAAASERTVHRTINVGTGRATSVAQVAREVCAHFPEARTVTAPRPKGDPFGGCADVTRLERLLGWRPAIDLRTGVARYVDWVRANPDLVPEWL